MMTSSIYQERVWFITGTSSGLGRALAEAVLEKGEAVVLTARNPQKVEDLAVKFQGRALALQLDVTKPKEVQDAVKQAIDYFGHIDVLVNNAGFKIVGLIEELSESEVRRQFDTNFFGVLETLRAIIPHMRKQRKGHILNISSMASFMAEPGEGFYTASKLALEGISGTLHYELQPFGIKVLIVEPGNFLTNITASVVINDTQIQEEEYKAFIHDQRNGISERDIERRRLVERGDPRKAALAMIKIVDSEQPIVRLVLGTDAIETINYGLEYIKRDLDACKELSISTDFDEVQDLRKWHK